MHLTNGTTKKQNVQSLIKTEPLKIELSKNFYFEETRKKVLNFFCIKFNG